jgi:hypothetical protein
MCPVCILTAGLSIVSGLITTSGLSTVALTKTVMRGSTKKSAQRTDVSSGGKGLAQAQGSKTQETSR